MQAFIQHKQEECVGRLQSLHCQGQNMSHLQHQSHMQNQMSHQQNRTSMTGSGVIFNQTQELVSQGLLYINVSHILASMLSVLLILFLISTNSMLSTRSTKPVSNVKHSTDGKF